PFVADRVDDIPEPLMVLEVGDVLNRSGGQVVDDLNRVSGREKGVRQVRADEAGAAGDEYVHAFGSPEVGDGCPVAAPSSHHPSGFRQSSSGLAGGYHGLPVSSGSRWQRRQYSDPAARRGPQ